MKREWPSQDFVDPVCGMKVSLKSAQAESSHRGRKYFFCAPICKERFEQDPQKYARAQDDVRVGVPERRTGNRGRQERAR